MTRIGVIVSFLCCCFQATAQDLSWSLALKENSSSPYMVSIGDSTIIWGLFEPRAELITPNGSKEISTGYYNDLLLCVNLKGDLLWKQNFPENVKIEALCHEKNGNIVVIISDRFDDIEPIDPNSEESVLYLFIYSPGGTLISKTRCPDFNAADQYITAIRSDGTGGYILVGGADENVISTAHPEKIAGPKGGDFVLSLNSTGATNWVQVHSFIENKGLFRIGDGPKLAMDSKGRIYVGGTYRTGAAFNEGETKFLAPQKFIDIKNGVEPRESYLACYNRKGKFKWVRTTKNRGVLTALTCDNRKVYFGYKPEDAYSFDAKIDTSNEKKVVVAAFKKRGKLAWHFSSIGSEISDLRTIGRNSVAFIQSHRHYGEPIQYRGQKITEKDDLLITELSAKGDFIKLRKSGLTLSTHNASLHLLSDQNQNLYCVGHIWCALSVNFSLYDQSFPQVPCHGGAGFVGKFIDL